MLANKIVPEIQYFILSLSQTATESGAQQDQHIKDGPLPNVGLAEFASGAHANNPVLHCNKWDQVPSSCLPVPSPHSQWAVCFIWDNVCCQQAGGRFNYWYICKLCQTKLMRNQMKFACNLKQHETKTREKIQQVAAFKRLAEAGEPHNQDTEAISMLEEDSLHRIGGSSTLLSHFATIWYHKEMA
jgi:hypothetical protein